MYVGANFSRLNINLVWLSIPVFLLIRQSTRAGRGFTVTAHRNVDPSWKCFRLSTGPCWRGNRDTGRGWLERIESKLREFSKAFVPRARKSFLVCLAEIIKQCIKNIHGWKRLFEIRLSWDVISPWCIRRCVLIEAI